MEELLNNIFYRKKDKTKLIFHGSTWLGFLLIGIFLIWGFRRGIFTSSQAFSEYVIGLGVMAPIVFIFTQAVQVVIPILPGAIGCAAGVIAFGPVWGFIYNYVGICIGSVIAFAIAKKYGVQTVKKLVKEKPLTKYLTWLNKGTLFDKMFAIAIFSPVAPDDLLCYIAGLTKMSYLKFTLIIILCKPFSIFLYSIGLSKLLILLGF